MTMQEAKARATEIWGGNRLVSVIRQLDGRIDVHLLPAGIASDTRERNYTAHRLDADGHVVCHDDCRSLEP